MKKTVTTILSLALALILVSSLSSGVTYAKGFDKIKDHFKKKATYHTVRDVAIMDCLAVTNGNGGKIVVVAFDISEVPDVFMVSSEDSCAATLALLLSAGFGKHSNTGIAAGLMPKFTRIPSGTSLMSKAGTWLALYTPDPTC